MNRRNPGIGSDAEFRDFGVQVRDFSFRRRLGLCDFGFRRRLGLCDFGFRGQARDFQVLGGGQVAVEQVHLLVGQGFGLLLGEAALNQALDEPIGVKCRCGCHRAIVTEEIIGCNRRAARDSLLTGFRVE